MLTSRNLCEGNGGKEKRLGPWKYEFARLSVTGKQTKTTHISNMKGVVKKIRTAAQ